MPGYTSVSGTTATEGTHNDSIETVLELFQIDYLAEADTPLCRSFRSRLSI